MSGAAVHPQIAALSVEPKESADIRESCQWMFGVLLDVARVRRGRRARFGRGRRQSGGGDGGAGLR
ncbi:MAG: hypothetical protein ACLUI3_03050 [Christensenellales bacterium]